MKYEITQDKTLFFCPEGPMIRYGSGFLRVSDLNPEVSLVWRVTRWEMVKIGIRFILAAAARRRLADD